MAAEKTAEDFLYTGPYGKIYQNCCYNILGMKENERTPMNVYHMIDDELKKAAEFSDRAEREKCRKILIARVEPYIYYGHCEGCGVRLGPDDDSFCSRDCEIRHDWRYTDENND
jgi:hypothetical protein